MNNPYEVLKVSQNTAKSDIIRAKMSAMKERQYTLQEIQIAEKQLLDPAKRLAADFLFPVKIKSKRPQFIKIDMLIEDINMDMININAFDSINK
jgi:hypothetical protein